MPEQFVKCPVCEGEFGKCQLTPIFRDGIAYHCEGCGRFEVTGTAYNSWFAVGHKQMTPIQRSALSHALRTGSSDSEPFVVTSDWIKGFLKNPRLPSPAMQAASLIECIGDCQATEGNGYLVDPETDTPLIGALSVSMFNDLVSELSKKGLIKQLEQVKTPHPRGGDGHLRTHRLGLTLDGWERYENEKRGHFAGDYGFIAMQFGDPTLENLVSDALRPAVRTQLGYDLVDMRNIAQAGVIDNIMRGQIRDAAFVLVDLTHDNAGAYWEAGYAEGLGKPVIYLCDREKFDAKSTHFDTNHCTTVMWSIDDTEAFIESLVATLRRSLSLFKDRISS